MQAPVPHFAHRPVAPIWRLPQDADRDDVEMDFIGGDTVTGEDLERRELEGPGALFFPEVKPGAPRFKRPLQVVDMRWHGPGDRGRSCTRIIEAAATLEGTESPERRPQRGAAP